MIELINNFKACQDFDYFKNTYGKKTSYVAALFVHKFVFELNTRSLVMAGHRVCRFKIHDEIVNLINLLPKEYIDGLKIGSAKISSDHNKILFSGSDANNLRGRTLDMVYCENKETVMKTCHFKPSDIENVYLGIR